MARITAEYAKRAYLQSFAKATVEEQAAMMEALDAIHLLKRGKLLYEEAAPKTDEPDDEQASLPEIGGDPEQSSESG